MTTLLHCNGSLLPTWTSHFLDSPSRCGCWPSLGIHFCCQAPPYLSKSLNQFILPLSKPSSASGMPTSKFMSFLIGQNYLIFGLHSFQVIKTIKSFMRASEFCNISVYVVLLCGFASSHNQARFWGPPLYFCCSRATVTKISNFPEIFILLLQMAFDLGKPLGFP